jgi:hypothetical protein
MKEQIDENEKAILSIELLEGRLDINVCLSENDIEEIGRVLSNETRIESSPKSQKNYDKGDQSIYEFYSCMKKIISVYEKNISNLK